MKEIEEPAATETVEVPLPEPPPTLQRRSLSLKTVTGELLLVFFLMFWYCEPFWPLAVRYWKMSGGVSQVEDRSKLLTMTLGNLSKGGQEKRSGGDGLHGERRCQEMVAARRRLTGATIGTLWN